MTAPLQIARNRCERHGSPELTIIKGWPVGVARERILTDECPCVPIIVQYFRPFTGNDDSLHMSENSQLRRLTPNRQPNKMIKLGGWRKGSCVLKLKTIHKCLSLCPYKRQTLLLGLIVLRGVYENVADFLQQIKRYI